MKGNSVVADFGVNLKLKTDDLSPDIQQEISKKVTEIT